MIVDINMYALVESRVTSFSDSSLLCYRVILQYVSLSKIPLAIYHHLLLFIYCYIELYIVILNYK